MNKNYELARRYCFKLDPLNHKDLLHDAYVQWYKYKNSNLFECENKLVICVIRNLFWNKVKKEKMYYKDGAYLPRQFQTIEAYHSSADSLIENELTTEAKFNSLVKILTSREKDILHYKLLGFNGEEISEKLQVKSVLISYSLNQIKKKYQKLKL